jgi:amidase
MVPIGKTNTPELGSGSQTFNAVLGTTRNPWDPTRTPGGSSGGATAALACGSVSLADGSDLGGSLRNPASFCGVVGFRPSKGEFPHEPDRDDAGMATAGPMGRTVGDVLLFHDALKGCTDPVPHTTAPRVAYSRDLGGLPVHSEVRRVIDEAVRALVDAGWCVDEAEPELGDADAPFDDLRGLSYWGAWSHLLDEETVKEDVQHELRHGRALSGDDIRRALDAESRVQDRWEAFLSGTDGGSGYDLLVAPVSQVPPFPVGLSSVPEIDGVTLPHYKDWMRSCCRITVTGAPAISVPAGFTADGLPIGLQMAGRRSHDRTLLGHALAAEEVFGTAPAPDIGALATTDPATLPPGPLG